MVYGPKSGEENQQVPWKERSDCLVIRRRVRQKILASSRPSGEDGPKLSIMVDSGKVKKVV